MTCSYKYLQLYNNHSIGSIQSDEEDTRRTFRSVYVALDNNGLWTNREAHFLLTRVEVTHDIRQQSEVTNITIYVYTSYIYKDREQITGH